MRGQALPIEIGPEKAGIGSSIPSLPPYFYDKTAEMHRQDCHEDQELIAKTAGKIKWESDRCCIISSQRNRGHLLEALISGAAFVTV
jgi:hypothetical protein